MAFRDPTWPSGEEMLRKIDAWLTHKGSSPEVRARVLRLNPNHLPGAVLRGYHPTPTIRKCLHSDVVSRAKFEKRYGKGSASRLPKQAFRDAGGKRRWITGLAYVQGLPS